MNDTEIAQIAYEAIRNYCIVSDDGLKHTPWDESPEWVKTSFTAGVRWLRLHPKALSLFSADNHNHWLNDRKSKGWKWGEIKDISKKENPCIVPYDELPPYQVKKDNLFKAIVGILN
jgi:hypothetical protein